MVDFYMSARKSQPVHPARPPQVHFRSTRPTPPPNLNPMSTPIDLASERGALVRGLIQAQSPMWSHVVVRSIAYDDHARTYTCFLYGHSAGGVGCLNHPHTRHDGGGAVIWFQVTIHGVRQRCTHRTFTDVSTGVKCRAYVSPAHRNGYTVEAMIRLFPSSVPVHRGSTARRRQHLAPAVSVQDIYNQHGSDYDVLAHEEWFNQP